MSGIADTSALDVLALAADGSVVLAMVEDREWGSDPLQAEQLKQKINRYTGYVVQGTLVADYPQVAGAAVTIQLECVSAPTGEFAEIIEVTTGGLRRLGVSFVVKVRDSA